MEAYLVGESGESGRERAAQVEAAAATAAAAPASASARGRMRTAWCWKHWSKSPGGRDQRFRNSAIRQMSSWAVGCSARVGAPPPTPASSGETHPRDGRGSDLRLQIRISVRTHPPPPPTVEAERRLTAATASASVGLDLADYTGPVLPPVKIPTPRFRSSPVDLSPFARLFQL